jgi:hypothetical protein
MESLETFPNNDISQCELEIYPLSFKMVQEAWAAVTIKAGYIIVRRCLPRFDILLHVVTEATK